MKSVVAVVLLSLGSIAALRAQTPDGLKIELKPMRAAMLGHQSLELELRVSNVGTKSVAAISRAQLVAQKSVLVAGRMDGPERKGQWAELLSKAPEGSWSALQPGESFALKFTVRLPDSVSASVGQCTLQWVGRSGLLKDLRSTEANVTILSSASPTMTLETEEGVITLELWADKAPNHVANMISLARAGFYDGTVFHRIIPGFMIQGGCPKGDGTGDAGYKIPDEATTGEFMRGVLGMARRSEPHSAGSQFFICTGDAPHLNGKYAAFGRVLDGLEVVDRIVAKPAEKERAIQPVKVLKATAELPKDFKLADLKKA
jgi:peptidyl-prolyl cis-trans isomerase B (cyclophilin B)